ncbi:pyruvate/2-oxoglutarate dehydrogenase complex dihydrolipoamide dehydrogenase (E3) component [Aliiruegeria haliotis]|uniref:Pyruvate/2-oxoglutarate dehydrogenase complex dihydrolipoamide dehydrogenase (E3) component n=1 Tax=Aliiruegeria haliotis TaxID=1280846 RepID=A0A2T0RJ28_9RHOB|nr:FAD-dependent oxidoreductase [Aliiruegeria haliotis]PRY21131.1 pyruvate/2-oxoglutarate dehydrogenase complex dihydrolipoamide dehydrogenase (E3) component [Aliiruegeria haliotis]
MKRIKTDICVIGAGSGGLSVAAGASQMGAQVVLLEGHRMGGDCLNYGCVPSKALLAAGKAAQAMREGRPFGVTPVDPEISYTAAKDHVRRAIETIEPVDSQERFEGLGVTVLREYGSFVSETEVEAGDTTISARRFVIATGSSPFVPPIDGLSEVPFWTNETIFDLRDAPEHLIVIGGGPIGLEMAQAHRRLGCRVTVVEAMEALGAEDPEIRAVVLQRLREEGVDIRETCAAEGVRQRPNGVVVETSAGPISGSHLLVAVGRVPNVERLNAEAAGIDVDRRGIKVDANLRTSNRRVHAIGDVVGGAQFTHVAGYHAGVIIRSMLFGLPARTRTDHIPHATYTDPELSQIGLTEAEARATHGDRLEVVRFPYAENDRAIAEGRTTGLIKVMVVKGRPVGVSIVGSQAGEMIGLWALVMANKLKMSAVAGTVLPYPTLGEVNKQAAGAYFSPRLFDSPWVKKFVGFIQRRIP